MSSNEEGGSVSNDDFSSPASPIQPMTDWSNTMEQQPHLQGVHGDDSGSLHGSLAELSPILAVWADDEIIGDTLSITDPDSPMAGAGTSAGLASNRSAAFSQTPAAAAAEEKQQKSEPTGAGSTSSTNGAHLFGPMESFEEKPPLELPTKTRLKVRIKRLRLVGGWRWVDGKEDACGICRTPFETCCMECKFPGDECPLVLGQCKHPFHMHCIVKWTNSQNGQKPACPLCRQEWKFATS